MLSERLKTLRKEAGLTQEEVAKKLGISRPAYTYWEKGEKRPTPDKLTQIASLFGVSTDYLLNSNSDDIDLSEVELLFRTTSKGMTEEEQEIFKKELIEFMKERKKVFEGRR